MFVKMDIHYRYLVRGFQRHGFFPITETYFLHEVLKVQSAKF